MDTLRDLEGEMGVGLIVDLCNPLLQVLIQVQEEGVVHIIFL